MSLTDTTSPSQGDALSFVIDLPHSPSTVWRALTDAALLSEWLLPMVDLSLAPGAAFAFKAPPQPGWDGMVNCRLLTIDAPRTLRYACVVGDIDTVVTFTLAATPSGTRLSLSQSGFKDDQKRNFGGARYGWRMMGGKLVELLARLP